MLDTLAALEADRAARTSTYWFGETFGHADIVVATALRHFSEAHPGFVDMADYPALSAHAARMEAMPVFQEISQVFIRPPDRCRPASSVWIAAGAPRRKMLR